MTHRHFNNKEFKPSEAWLSDEEYGRARDAIVNATADAFITRPDGRVLLGLRTEEPCKDWWYIGGRMKPGESFTDALIQNLERETEITFNAERFVSISTYSLVWPRRNQRPVEHGCHDCSNLFWLELTNEEAEKICLNSRDFTQQDWFTEYHLLKNPQYQPAIKMAVLDLRVVKFRQELFDATRNANFLTCAKLPHLAANLLIAEEKAAAYRVLLGNR